MTTKALLPLGSARSIALLVICWLALSGAAEAQTTFAWPDTTASVSAYATVEECLAAINRASTDGERRQALLTWADTEPLDPESNLRPSPKPITDVAQRCGEKFSQPNVPLLNYKSFLALFLAAGRDSDAATLIYRRLAAVDSGRAHDLRGAVVDSLVDTLMAVRPARRDLAVTLLAEQARHVDRILRILVYTRMLGVADLCGDTALSNVVARRVLTAVDSLTPADTQSTEFERRFPPPLGVGPTLYEAIVSHLRGSRIELDSLRRGTAALASLETSWWRQLAHSLEGFPRVVGDTAPRILGDFWYPDSAARLSLPQTGQVSLVVMLPAVAMGDGVSAEIFAVLRRLKRRAPTLQVTVLTQTQGHSSYALAASPAEEAEWYRKSILANLAALTVAVDSGRFFRLPPPDSRWVSRPDTNVVAYALGRASGLPSYLEPISDALLVDQDGLVVFRGQVTKAEEIPLSAMIDVLVHRVVGRP